MCIRDRPCEENGNNYGGCQQKTTNGKVCAMWNDRPGATEAAFRRRLLGGGGGSSSGAFFWQAASAMVDASIRPVATRVFIGCPLLNSVVKSVLPPEFSPCCSSMQLRQDRSPGRVRRIDRGRQAAQIVAGQIDLPQRCLTAVSLGAEELDDAAIGGPCRGLVLPAIGQRTQVAAIGTHHRDVEIARDVRERDLVAARAPFGRRRASAEKGQAALSGAIGIHDVDLLAARPVTFEHDLAAVGRIGG
mgnify:CR=1 FL=1